MMGNVLNELHPIPLFSNQQISIFNIHDMLVVFASDHTFKNDNIAHHI